MITGTLLPARPAAMVGPALATAVNSSVLTSPLFVTGEKVDPPLVLCRTPVPFAATRMLPEVAGLKNRLATY